MEGGPILHCFHRVVYCSTVAMCLGTRCLTVAHLYTYKYSCPLKSKRHRYMTRMYKVIWHWPPIKRVCIECESVCSQSVRWNLTHHNPCRDMYVRLLVKKRLKLESSEPASSPSPYSPANSPPMSVLPSTPASLSRPPLRPTSSLTGMWVHQVSLHMRPECF